MGFFIFIRMITIEQIYDLFCKHPLVFTDSRLAFNGGLFFALKGEHFDGNDFALKAINDGAHYAIVDRLSLAKTDKCIFVSDVLETLQHLANYHRRQLALPVLAITGTNGKTTTKELVASVLMQTYQVLFTQGNFNNHIGVPLTLLKLTSQHQIAVIEMGANHPGEIESLCAIAEPDYGLITNVGKAHLEGFGSFEGVKKTKAELYHYIAHYGKGIFINIDNPHLIEMSADNKNQFTYAPFNKTAQLKGELANKDLFVVAKVLFPKGWLYLKSKLTGSYNLENILAAIRIGMYFDIDPLLIQKGIESYTPSNNRSQIYRKGDVTFLLDCYNANPSSMEVAIQNFVEIDKPEKLLIIGDMLELGEESLAEHQRIVDIIVAVGLREVVLVGPIFSLTDVPRFVKRYVNVEKFKADLQFQALHNKFVLIKGSRGIQLEKLIEGI